MTGVLQLNIVTAITKTISELEPGELYITVAAFRREGVGSNAINNIRRRTQDPFKSETFFGTRVTSYPSDKVYVVQDSSNG